MASTNPTLATAFVGAWVVAVRHRGVPVEICSQSRKPVATVKREEQAPTISASHQPCANACSATPNLLRIAAIVANVYAPIVTSVSGGWLGCPGKPRSGFMGTLLPQLPVEQRVVGERSVRPDRVARDDAGARPASAHVKRVRIGVGVGRQPKQRDPGPPGAPGGRVEERRADAAAAPVRTDDEPLDLRTVRAILRVCSGEVN